MRTAGGGGVPRDACPLRAFRARSSPLWIVMPPITSAISHTYTNRIQPTMRPLPVSPITCTGPREKLTPAPG